ncbi:MAG: hypothetical protein ACOZF0_07905 [Thermodesulfobacteriota bacterium]
MSRYATTIRRVSGMIGILLLAGVIGCTSGHEILKYENPILTSQHQLVPGLEPEEASEKFAVDVIGQGIEPETGSPQQKKLMAERAAVIDGYRKLSERIAGTILNAYTAAGRNNISVDHVITETNAYLRGAQVSFISHEDGIASARVKVYMSPREYKFYHGTPTSRAVLGALAGAGLGAAAGSGAGAALGTSSYTMEALGGTAGAMALGAGGGGIGGAALSNN